MPFVWSKVIWLTEMMIKNLDLDIISFHWIRAIETYILIDREMQEKYN